MTFLKLIEPDDNFLQIYEWKHAPDTLKASFSSKKPSYEQFLRDYKAKFHSIEKLPPQWILFNNQKVGVLYFEPHFKPPVAQISLFLDPSFQGQEIGAEALKLGLIWAQNADMDEIVAFVKEDNIRAIKAFKKASFIEKGTATIPKYNALHKCFKMSYLTKDTRNQTFVIAEAGSNFHIGDRAADLKHAFLMMEKAYEAGADAVKFQLYDGKSVYAQNAGMPGYLNQDIHAIFDEYAMPTDFLEKLSFYACYLGIELMCSFFSEKHFKLVDPFVKRHKIASYEIRHLRLLELAAKSQKPLYLSTGASTEEDIQFAIDTFKQAGGKELILLHCNAQYPAAPSGLNLNCIPAMRETFKVPVGFSDHSTHPLHAPLLAVGLGASCLEKHFTTNRKLKGPDHFFALECEELKEMVFAVREAEKMLGLAKKEVFDQERELAQFARRSLQAIKKIEPGDLFIEGLNVGILRPGNQKAGLHPKYITQIEKRKALKSIEVGSGIDYQDVLWE